jgi:hypothetical protein
VKNLVEPVMEDLSTAERFLFRICCESCGGAYAAKPTRFSKAGMDAPTSEKRILYKALYEQEHSVARRRALDEAVEHINVCPICKRLVCNQCFLICEDLDMCRDCAEQLKETGVPVALGSAAV